MSAIRGCFTNWHQKNVKPCNIQNQIYQNVAPNFLLFIVATDVLIGCHSEPYAHVKVVFSLASVSESLVFLPTR